MTKYEAFDSNRNLLYKISRRRVAYEMTEPGSDIVTFAYKPKNWMGQEYCLVDAPVNYVMASFRADEVLDPAGMVVGKIEQEVMPAISSLASMFDKQRMQTAMSALYRRKFSMQGTVAMRFEIERKTGGISIYVLRPELKYMSKALALAISLRILTAGQALTSSGD